MERSGAVLQRVVNGLRSRVIGVGTDKSSIDSQTPSQPTPEVRYFPQEEDRHAEDLRLSIGELFPLMAFRQVPQYSLERITMPIAGSDLMDASQTRGLIGGIERFRCVNVSLQCGLDEDLPIFPHIGTFLTVTVPHSRSQKCGLDLWSARSYHASRPEDFRERKSFVAFRQDQDSLQEVDLFDESLTSKNRAHQVVGELKAIFRRLRSEFLTSEASRIHLTPAQKAMVEAVTRRGMAIHQNPGSRGLRDQFVLIGSIGEKRELLDLTVIFSAASNLGKSEWKNPRVLDHLDLNWGERKIRGLTTSEIIVNPQRAEDHNYRFKGRGTLRVWRKGANEHLASVSTNLHQVDNLRPFVSVPDYLSAMFKRHLCERLNVPLDKNAAYSGVLLGTSIPD